MTITSTSEITAEAKKPRLIAVMPLRSFLRGATRKMPSIAVMTPTASADDHGGRSGPASPNAALPRISDATSMTE